MYKLLFNKQANSDFKLLLNVLNVFTAFNVGKGAIAGGAAVGLGALCYYGLGLGNESGAIDRSM
jgi:hypothetical protein